MIGIFSDDLNALYATSKNSVIIVNGTEENIR
jgi:hypothetical protein